MRTLMFICVASFVISCGGTSSDPSLEPVGDPVVEAECLGDDSLECDDDKVCTVDSCVEGKCVHELSDAECDDGDACTIDDLCSDEGCLGSALVCDDGESCTSDECDSEQGCVFESREGEECDDGEICTSEDRCEEGSCVAGGPTECDDGNACTTDSCDPEEGCLFELTLSQDCRPNIVVEYPERAAALVWEDTDEPTITVVGSVVSGAGPITDFTLNGAEVELDEDGRFAVEYTPSVGGNTLEFDAVDSQGTKRKRVQAFHWAISYRDPRLDEVEVPCSGTIADGMCFQAVAEPEMQWSPAEQSCQEWGGHLAGIHSLAQNEAVHEQQLSVCGEEPAWIGLNDNLKEGNYVWADGWKFDPSGPPQLVPATITGVSGEPLDGTMADAVGLADGGAALQDGEVGGGLGSGVYLSSAPGSYPSDYFDSGLPIILDYDFGGTASVSSFRVGLYDYDGGVGHPNSATSFSIHLGSGPGLSDVAEGIVVNVDVEGPPGQILYLGATYEAAYARVEILDNGYDEESGGTDPAGGHRVGLSEAAFDATLDFENWAPGEPNDWENDEDVIGMWADGLWNDFNGNVTLNCYVCAKPATDFEFVGHSDPGMGIFLKPELIDDGDHSMPANDLGTIFEMVFGDFDLSKSIPNPAAENVSASGGTYDVFINDLTNDEPTVGLTLIEDGWLLQAQINNVQADIYAPKKSGGFLLPSTITGTMNIATINVTANVYFSVTEDHQLDADVQDIEVSIEGVDLSIDGWLGWLIEAVLEGTLDSLVGDIEDTLATELGGILTPLLLDALGTLAFGFDFELPSINPESPPVGMDIKTDFSYVDFTPDGDLLALRSIATPKEAKVAYESPGAPAREGCGLTEQTLEILREAPMEIVMNDDTVNLVFFSAWRGGFLDFDVPESLLSGVNLQALSVKDLQANVSGLLPPAVSDCANGELILHVGDLKLSATMEFIGKPLDVEAYVSFEAKFEIGASEGEINFGVNDVGNVKLELNVLQDDMISVEPLLTLMIKDNLVPALTEGLSGDSLGGLPLPDVELDVSGSPISMGITPTWVKRQNGNNVVGAELDFESVTESTTPAEE